MNRNEARHDVCKSLHFITLKIEKFSEFAREGKDARRLSQPISVQGLPWQIVAKPRESRQRDANGQLVMKRLGYFLQCNAENLEPNWSFSATVKLKLLAQKEGKEDHEREIKIRNICSRMNQWGIAQFISYDELMDPRNGWYDESNDSIVLRTEIVFDVPLRRKGPSQTSEKVLEYLFDNRDKYSDCTLLSSDGVELKVFKGILASQSPIFEAMFEHKMIEAQNGRVEIVDIESNVLEEMIRFMYNGRLMNMENIAEDLLVAAEKYEVANLKMICERILVNSLDNKNSCRLLVLAGQNSVKFLRDKAIEHIKGNVNEIMQTEGWKTLINGNYGEFVEQIFRAIIPKQQKGDGPIPFPIEVKKANIGCSPGNNIEMRG